MNLRLANMINGLVFPHDHVCYFQSQYGHHRSLGYFKSDSVPHEVALRFFLGDTITIVDATSHNKPYTDTQKFGVVTWCMVMNRAMNQWVDWVADWPIRNICNETTQINYCMYLADAKLETIVSRNKITHSG